MWTSSYSNSTKYKITSHFLFLMLLKRTNTKRSVVKVYTFNAQPSNWRTTPVVGVSLFSATSIMLETIYT